MKKYLYKNRKWLKTKYCKEKLSITEIAVLCVVSKPTIYKWIYDFHLTREKVFPRRSKSRYSLNEKYFKKIDNSNKAYWLGFIAADGCLRNTKGQRKFYIELARKDRGHIEKFRKEIEYKGPIYDIERKGRKTYSSKIEVCCCGMVQDLVKHGILQNKTKTLKRPNIDKKYYHHWIRGMFDGDGSISLCHDGILRGEFFGNKDIMEFIVENIPGTNMISSKKLHKGSYYHSFGGNKISQKIYDYLYRDGKTYLNRKKEKFLLKVKD